MAGGLRTSRRAGDRTEQLEIGLAVGLGQERRAIDSECGDLERFGDDGLIGEHVSAVEAAVGLGPQAVAMEERRAVALAEGQRRELEPRHTLGTKRVAVERGVGAVLRQRRHHIGERPERASFGAEHAGREPLRRKAATHGLEQGNSGLEHE